MIRRPPRSTLFPYHDALPIFKHGDETFNAAPTLYFNPRMGATMAEPSIKSEFFRDVYISPQEYEPPNDQNTARLGVNAKKEIGPYTITFLGFDANEAHT